MDAPDSFIKPFRDAGLNDTHATYLAMIENIDFNLGRLMKFLEETNRDKETIVIMINDNGVTEGLDVYNANMRGPKCSAWEGGTRAFSFWRWPGKWTPRVLGNLTAHLDVLPTLCDLAGAKIPQEIDEQLEGFSLEPLLSGKIPAWNGQKISILYHHVARWPSGYAEKHKYTMAGVRKGNHLMLRSYHCGDVGCLQYMSQCQALRIIEEVVKTRCIPVGQLNFTGVSAHETNGFYSM